MPKLLPVFSICFLWRPVLPGTECPQSLQDWFTASWGAQKSFSSSLSTWGTTQRICEAAEVFLSRAMLFSPKLQKFVFVCLVVPGSAPKRAWLRFGPVSSRRMGSRKQLYKGWVNSERAIRRKISEWSVVSRRPVSNWRSTEVRRYRSPNWWSKERPW